MTGRPKQTTSTVIATLRYHDAPGAITWLCRAFGSEPSLVVPGENGSVVHAQLRFGNGMVMLASADDGHFGRFVKPPRDLGGVGSQSLYLIVDDADAHRARAVGAGAEIVREIQDADYSGRGYSRRDPEGHVWSFGTYEPWV